MRRTFSTTMKRAVRRWRSARSPALVGEAAQLPFLLVLIGIAGGMQSFGLLGLFLGLVIMAALVIVAALLSVWANGSTSVIEG